MGHTFKEQAFCAIQARGLDGNDTVTPGVALPGEEPIGKESAAFFAAALFIALQVFYHHGAVTDAFLIGSARDEPVCVVGEHPADLIFSITEMGAAEGDKGVDVACPTVDVSPDRALVKVEPGEDAASTVAHKRELAGLEFSPGPDDRFLDLAQEIGGIVAASSGPPMPGHERDSDGLETAQILQIAGQF